MLDNSRLRIRATGINSIKNLLINCELKELLKNIEVKQWVYKIF